MIKRLVLHPFLLAVFPGAAIYSRNVYYTSLRDFLGTSAIVLLLTALVWLGLWLLLRNRQKAGLLTSLILILCFSYSALSAFVDDVSVLGVALGRHRYRLALDLVLFLGAGFLLIRTKRDLRGLTMMLNTAGACLVTVSMTFIIYAWVRGGGILGPSVPESNIPIEFGESRHIGRLPDIYYIVLDGYGRSDVLQELYDHDNGEFLDSLRQKGFFVADRSTANYSFTLQSVSSALNMEYIQHLLPGIDKGSKDRGPLRDLIQNNRVVNTLQRRFGYKFVALSSGYYYTDCTNANIYVGLGIDFGEFQYALLSLTPIPILVDKVLRLNPYSFHRNRILMSLENLPRFPEIKGHIFVFAHLIIPHPPFVFDEAGRDVSPQTVRFDLEDRNWGSKRYNEAERRAAYREEYRRQVVFINRKIEQVVDDILRRSSAPPVIIIQGDHGPFSLGRAADDPRQAWERLSILNACYFPQGSQGLYPEITPVNTFRLVLNTFFGARLPLLTDENYWASYFNPYDFQEAEIVDPRPEN